MKRLLPLIVLLLAACGGEASEEVDLSAQYEALGEPITAADALPVQAVAAEGGDLLGRQVKLEGRITEVCAMAGCWLSMQAVDGPLVRIDVPRTEDGSYAFTFPKDAAGRMAVVTGVLESGSADHHADHHEGGEAHEMDDAQEGHSDAETRVLNESVYTLTATGALVERVRA